MRAPATKLDGLPEGWAGARFEDLFVHVLGGDWGKSPDSAPEDWVDVSVVRGTEFRDWDNAKGRSAAHRRVKPSAFERRRLKPGDLVIEISGGGPDQPVGRPLLIDADAIRQNERPLICSNFCRQVRLSKRVNSKFILHCLKHMYGRGDFNRFQNQTVNIRNLQFPEFATETVVPIPPLAEQNRIVAKVEALLERVNRARERLARVPDILKRFRQSVLAAACSGQLTADWREENPNVVPASNTLVGLKKKVLGGQTKKRDRNLYEAMFDEFPPEEDAHDLPDTWVACRVGHIGQVFNGSTPSRKKPELWGFGVPWVSSGEVQNNIIRETREQITERGFAETSRRLLPVGTVLIAMIGEGKTRGQSAILDIEATINQNMAAIDIRHGGIESKYLWYWFQFQYLLTRQKGGGSGPQALNCQRVRELPLTLPPLEEQQEIVGRVTALFTLADRVEQRLTAATTRTERITQSILAKAFAGELVETEADLARREGRDYEPASVLLQRIAAERQSAANAKPKRAKKPKKRPPRAKKRATK